MDNNSTYGQSGESNQLGHRGQYPQESRRLQQHQQAQQQAAQASQHQQVPPTQVQRQQIPPTQVQPRVQQPQQAFQNGQYPPKQPGQGGYYGAAEQPAMNSPYVPRQQQYPGQQPVQRNPRSQQAAQGGQYPQQRPPYPQQPQQVPPTQMQRPQYPQQQYPQQFQQPARVPDTFNAPSQNYPPRVAHHEGRAGMLRALMTSGMGRTVGIIDFILGIFSGLGALVCLIATIILTIAAGSGGAGFLVTILVLLIGLVLTGVCSLNLIRGIGTLIAVTGKTKGLKLTAMIHKIYYIAHTVLMIAMAASFVIGVVWFLIAGGELMQYSNTRTTVIILMVVLAVVIGISELSLWLSRNYFKNTCKVMRDIADKVDYPDRASRPPHQSRLNMQIIFFLVFIGLGILGTLISVFTAASIPSIAYDLRRALISSGMDSATARTLATSVDSFFRPNFFSTFMSIASSAISFVVYLLTLLLHNKYQDIHRYNTK